MTTFIERALGELAAVLAKVDDGAIGQAVTRIRQSRRIALYGVGREGLQIKGFAMRLYHLGLSASVVGDMTTPPLGSGDMLIVSAGPGRFSTVEALLVTARRAGAATLCLTAQPGGACAVMADQVVVVPAQTMADNPVAGGSVLPMGSLYEGALYLLFESMVARLQQALRLSDTAMAANHTNLE
ncbi:SIS domain-containing protein [Martelella alba]|uniref:SIS domain-containing protein n=1 Tax=Martelella alba TaxID=2590451 RepID=A0ABY2SHD0_9HYPH|nr:SIS domain-containing protein [Martelella alba]TKI04699.1 SIS domain-containing protein [Martelella alba]